MAELLVLAGDAEEVRRALADAGFIGREDGRAVRDGVVVDVGPSPDAADDFWLAPLAVRFADERDGPDARERLIVAALAVMRRLAARGMRGVPRGAPLEDIPQLGWHPREDWTAADLPPSGAPRHVWAAGRRFRRPLATPRRRALLGLAVLAFMALGVWADIADGRFGEGRKGWIVLPSVAFVFVGVIAEAVADLRRGTNRFPRVLRERGLLAAALFNLLVLAVLAVLTW